MSSKRNKPYDADKKEKTSVLSVKTKKKIRLPKIPLLGLVFILYCLFAAIIYRDVFYICEQFSYFAFDSVLMQEVVCVKNGLLQVLGRFFLLSFRYSWLGGLVFSFILTAITYFLIYIFNLKNYWRLLAVIPGLSWLSLIVYHGMNVFYHYDQATIFYVPVIALLLLMVISIVLRFVRKQKFSGIFSDRKVDAILPNYINCLVVVLLFVSITFFCQVYRQDSLASTKMMRLCQNQEWYEMIEYAQEVKTPTRTVAAYYAIALLMTDQLNEKLFDLFYQYPRNYLINRTDMLDIGMFLYEAEADFHCGLINTAYHYCMEHTVMAGKSAYKLKYMFLIALLNNEKELAGKYIELIGQMPFEQDFVEKYKPMLFDDDLVRNDNYLMAVYNMMPTDDAYEEQFPVPTFIGYHKMLTRGRSTAVLKNCIAACLYTKDMDGFIRLAQMLRNEDEVPACIEDALVVQAMRKNDINFLQQIPEYAVATTKQMLNEAAAMKGWSTKEKGQALKDKYTGKYSFYYFYQNLMDESYTEQDNVLNKISSSPNGSGVN